jgi:Calcineurin-like phosphoesterase
MSSAPGSFVFTVLNDLHYMNHDDRPWLEGLVRRVNETPGLELILVLGDLAETGSRDELAAAKGILDQLCVPYYVVPGNHDGPADRPMRVKPGDAGLADYESLFPGRRNYHFLHEGWQCIGLDTTNGSGYQHLPMPPETRAFVQEVARTLDRQAPTILFTHMPLDPTVPYTLGNGLELLDLLSPLNLRIVFSGHYHGFSEHVAPRNPQLKLLTNRCCSRARELHEDTTLRGYFHCVANADQSVGYQFVEYRGVK